MRSLYVIGTGGFAKETAQLADAINRRDPTWDRIAYICEAPEQTGKRMPFGPVIGTESLLETATSDVDVAIGIGSPPIRQRIAARLRQLRHVAFPNLVHPMAVFDSTQVQMGVGNLVTAGCVFTCDISLGDFNVFNLNTTVGHDAVIGSFNVFNPGSNLSGGVLIGDTCLGGTGCQILEQVSMASDTVLGAGGVLVKSIAERGGVFAGVPAKKIR